MTGDRFVESPHVATTVVICVRSGGHLVDWFRGMDYSVIQAKLMLPAGWSVCRELSRGSLLHAADAA